MSARLTLAVIGCVGGFALGGIGHAQILITEVIPGVTLSQTDGDKVELFNAGGAAVDLTDWVITDLDSDASGVEANPLLEGTFAPASLSVPLLQPGEFCVITFVDPASPEGDNSAMTAQAYGFDITIELEPDIRRNNDQACLFSSLGSMEDCVVYGSSPEATTGDQEGDMRALTLPDNNGYGVGVLGDQNGWAGLDNIGTDASYKRYAVAIDPPFDIEQAGGSGSIQRVNVGPVFMEGVPDGADFFVVEDVSSASLGAHTFSATDGTLALLTNTGDLENYLTFTLPGTKLDITQDTDTFTIPSAVDRVQFRRVIDLMLAGDFTRAHFFATPLGYEVIEWTDTPGTGDTFYVLQESANLGQPGFRGLGTYVFDNTSINHMCIQAPHAYSDSLTRHEVADMLVQVRPRLTMFAGTHRKNSTTDTDCDGTDLGGDPYRISDCAHTVISFFQMAHEQFVEDDPTAYVLQIHGFGTTPSAFDVIISEGRDYTPPGGNFSQILEDRIDAQSFWADGTDLTEAAVYSEDETVLGGQTNTQGRYVNGVQWALVSDNYAPAGTADGHFLHIEQDGDVRQENQHIIDATLETINIFGLPVELTIFTAGEE